MRRWGGRDKDAKGSVHLLEVGCGVGAMAFWLANNGFLVDAIDASREAVKRAEHLYGNIYPHSLHFWPMDISDLPSPYRDVHLSGFDGIVDVCCLQHVDDLDSAIGRIHDLLKPGAALFSIFACKDHSPVTRPELTGATFTRLTSIEVYRTFSETRWSQVKLESMTHTDNGHNISHWIIEATK